MIETGDELQLSDFFLLLSLVATVVSCTEVFVPDKFLLVSINMLPVEHEVHNALVVVWSGRAEHAVYHGT